jgi:hypothetical protein
MQQFHYKNGNGIFYADPAEIIKAGEITDQSVSRDFIGELEDC